MTQPLIPWPVSRDCADCIISSYCKALTPPSHKTAIRKLWLLDCKSLQTILCSFLISECLVMILGGSGIWYVCGKILVRQPEMAEVWAAYCLLRQIWCRKALAFALHLQSRLQTTPKPSHCRCAPEALCWASLQELWVRVLISQV